ncbi:hypothetical protein HY945_00360 [Candidatus Gottesmanbacteria bacterium]|nr:hypothetical protein [Candidatus Gottesmanbacteria bacterium]
MPVAVAPDLQQNILVTIYLLFSHNYIAFAYFIGVIIGIVLSLYRPSRFATFVLLGFAILLFSFEYDKHIISAFREQTVKSLITIQPHYKLQKIIELVITELLPVLFYVLGWLFIYLAIIYGAVKINNKNSGKKRNG